tara:strand:- start:3128 stop:3565 length:438 start_codon:yes stop_codon:yes gene_type:complete
MKKIYLPILALLISCQSTPPTDLGVVNGQLKKCPDKPNCVVSFDYGMSDQFLSPIESEEEPERIRQKIEGIVTKTSNAKIVENKPDYIRAEYTSTLFRFVDDVEFLFTEPGKVHFRSASRLGHSDLGANKDRIEAIRFKFHQNDF